MSDLRSCFIVGDVHGCLLELKLLLQRANWRRGQRLIFIGDLINKGPSSAAVLRFVRSLGAETILGNHERAYLRYLAKGKRGKPAFDQISGDLGDQLESYQAWLARWPLFVSIPGGWALHAGLPPGLTPRRTPAKLITNLRTWDGHGKHLWRDQDPAWFECYRRSELVVYGHWAARGLTIRANTIGLDSGCVYGGALSGLWLPRREIVQVAAAKVYQEIEKD